MLFRIVFLWGFVFFVNADPIPLAFVDVAKEANIPVKLFYATILTESRAPIKQNGRIKELPWPWTLNVSGQAKRFRTRKAAYDYLKAVLAQGVKQVGIGYGQHEWRWHKHRYKTLWDSLDPYKNLKVTAEILREIFDGDRPHCRRSWINTVGCYHRLRGKPKDRIIAIKYTIRVLEQWKNI